MMFELLGLFYKSSKKLEKRLKKIEEDMSIVSELVESVRVEQDAILANIAANKALILEVKQLLDDNNIDAVKALVDDVIANKDQLIAATLENTALADRIPDAVAVAQ